MQLRIVWFWRGRCGFRADFPPRSEFANDLMTQAQGRVARIIKSATQAHRSTRFEGDLRVGRLCWQENRKFSQASCCNFY